jgi:mono/diheme cytochrome c family protein
MPARPAPITAAALTLALLMPATSFAADSATPSKGAASAKGADTAKLARGKYLVKIAGCNDCHTPGYMASAGKVDEKLWLTGDTLGWRGPWGTTYAANLRTYFDKITEDQWVKIGRTIETRPPMPWFALRDMAENDLRAIHAYAKSLGPAGGPAPAYVPPDKEPKPPYATFPSPPPKK